MSLLKNAIIGWNKFVDDIKGNKVKKVECYHCGKMINRDEARTVRIQEDPKGPPLKVPLCKNCYFKMIER